VILAKKVIARAASARRVVFAALLRLEETLGVVGVNPGSCSGSLPCGADMMGMVTTSDIAKPKGEGIY
jgi:hypothetical protein